MNYATKIPNLSDLYIHYTLKKLYLHHFFKKTSKIMFLCFWILLYLHLLIILNMFFRPQIIVYFQVAEIHMSFETSNFAGWYLVISEYLCIFAHRYLKQTNINLIKTINKKQKALQLKTIIWVFSLSPMSRIKYKFEFCHDEKKCIMDER